MTEPNRRILFLASTLPVGGAETHLRDLLRGFQERGAEPHLWLFKEPGKLGEQIATEDEVPMRTKLRQGKSLLALGRRLRQEMKDLNPHTLVTLEHDDVMVLGRLAARFAGVPRAVTIMHTTNRRDGGQTLNRANRLMKKFSDLYIATAGGHRDHLLEEGIPEERLGVILNGIDTRRFFPREGERQILNEWGVGPQDPVVGMVAAFRPEKNHELALRAFADVRNKVPNAHMVFLGDGDTRQPSEELARELGLSQAAHFLGIRHDVDRVVRECDVVTLTSHPRVETFPFSLLEAMSSGCPAVSTDVGFIREMVRDQEDGYLVPAGDQEQLANAMVTLLGDTEKLELFQDRVRRKIEAEFSLDRMMKEYWQAILPNAAMPQTTAVSPESTVQR